MKTSNQAAKFRIDELQKAHGPLMSPCHPCDLQTEAWSSSLEEWNCAGAIDYACGCTNHH